VKSPARFAGLLFVQKIVDWQNQYKTVFGIRYRYVMILLLAVYSYLNILFTVGEKLFDFEVSKPELFLALFSVVFIVWELNRLTENSLPRIEKFFKNRIHPLVLLFFASLVNVVVAGVVVLTLLYLVVGINFPIKQDHITLLLAFGFRVNLFLNCLNAIVFYMNRTRKAQLEAEQFKKISAEAQFEALRNQINPHFLFNSFNVLSSLVYKDPDTSAKFIGQLSHVYRYLLYSQEKKIVLLQEEMEFIRAYLFLLEIRFGENLKINIAPFDDQNFYVAPATLQMLIENAIKHNIVSRKSPLTISIWCESRMLVISNNLQPKEIKEPSTKVGLQNIISRYLFLSTREVIVREEKGSFVVRIPLLTLEEK
jgi:two-component system, LytTR family, sensor kinase